MTSSSASPDLRRWIRDIPDFPKPGILFRDLTPLMRDPVGWRETVRQLAEITERLKPDLIVGIESRGFIVGTSLATALGLGFVPVRKPGKLPGEVHGVDYELEYGSATVELHTDAVKPGHRVLLIDDLIATGGTMMAGKKLLEKLGATVMEGAAIVDLPELGGSDKLRASGLPLFTLVDYSGH
jgi:adenine phosphoribosyltransferase